MSMRAPLCADCRRTSVSSRNQRSKTHQRYGVPLCKSCYEQRIQLGAGQRTMGPAPDMVAFDAETKRKAKERFEISSVRFVKIHHDKLNEEWLVQHRDGEPLFKLRLEEIEQNPAGDGLLRAVEARLAHVICGACGIRLLQGEQTVCGNCEGTAVQRLLALRGRLNG